MSLYLEGAIPHPHVSLSLSQKASPFHPALLSRAVEVVQ
jgi:hypothetical protein